MNGLLRIAFLSGVVQRSAADILNVGAKLWIMDPSVKSARDNIPLPNYILDAIRSIDGVKFAVPIYYGAGNVRLSTGRYQSVTIIGLLDYLLLDKLFILLFWKISKNFVPLRLLELPSLI